jgi:colanic acid/amylovoran biosynthesis protein
VTVASTALSASAGVPKASIRIGLLWHSAASGNLGVGALTISHIRILKDAAAEAGIVPEFVIIGMDDSGHAYVDGPDITVFRVNFRSLLNPAEFAATVRGCDCVFDIGAGDSFTDIYGAKRFFFMWATKMITAWSGTPLILAPQTIGPFTRWAYRRLARQALARSRLVVARDPQSAVAVRDLCPERPVILATDVAFALPFRSATTTADDGRIRVGMNVSGLLFREDFEAKIRFGLGYDYVELTYRLLDKLTAGNEVDIYIFSHTVDAEQPKDDDGAACDKVFSKYPSAKRVPPFVSPVDAKSFISGLDFVISARMHACIAAFSADVPVVPIAYSRKVHGVFDSLGYPWIVPARGMTTNDAVDFVLRALANKDKLREDIAKADAKVDAYLGAYRAEAVKLMRGLA